MFLLIILISEKNRNFLIHFTNCNFINKNIFSNNYNNLNHHFYFFIIIQSILSN